MATLKKEVRYLNKDFTQFRANLVEFAKNYFPNNYTDFNESSPGMMFMEMSAYVGDVLSYYTDNQLKESLITFAGEDANVMAIANVLGYKSKNRIPSYATLDVYQLLPAKTTSSGSKVPDYDYALTIRENMQVRSELKNIEFRTLNLVNFKASGSSNTTEVSVYSINDQDLSTEYYLLKKQVQVQSGTIKEKTFTFTSPRRFDKILLDDENLIDVIDITDSDGNLWYEVPNLAQDTIFLTVDNVAQNDPDLLTYADTVPYLLKLKKVPRRFITRFRSDKKLEIQFGSGVSDTADEELIPNPDNVGSSLIGLQKQWDHPIDPSNFLYTKAYGLAPSNTTLTVRYTVGGGIESNVPSGELTNIVGINFEIDAESLDATLLQRIKDSVACTNTEPASGGADAEEIEEIRYNALANFAAQSRTVTTQDYIIRCYTMPPKFGSIAKAYIVQDQQLNPQNTFETVPNPLALNLYTLGYDNNGYLINLNKAVKENLKTYLSHYRMLTDAINIKNAYIINIGIVFEIIVLPEYNSNEVLLLCISKLKSMFNTKNWQINQPIILSKIYTELDKVDGVQTVSRLDVVNLYDEDSGYSGNYYNVKDATRNGIVYPSLDPSIFEVKYPNKDIVGKVVSI